RVNIAAPADKRFFIFTRLWCFSTLFHLVSFSYWFQFHQFLIGFIGVSCILHLLKPIKNTFFYSGICGSLLLIASQIPHTANHIYFEWFLNLIFAGVIFLWLIKRQKELSLGNYFFANTLTVTRWSLVILSFFVVLHKLNYDYFDPHISCGAVLFQEIFQRSGVFSFGVLRDFYYAHEISFKITSIYFSLASEAIIPVLLIVKRWRNAGIVFGIIFHFLLSLHGHNGIFSFSAMLFTLFTFF